jgi:hypothetical protein
MIDRIKSLFGKVGDVPISQPQREAVIDLLLWTMYIDKRLALPETERIDQVPEEMAWEAVTPFPQYINTTVARVREVLSDTDRAEALLDDIYARLGTEPMRRRAFDACRDLAQVDGQMADEESQFLEHVRTRFGV